MSLSKESSLELDYGNAFQMDRSLANRNSDNMW